MKVNFKLLSETASLPSYSRDGDACMDIRSNEKAVIKAKSFAIVGTGVACEVPHGFELQLRARSGLAAKGGIGLVNGIGTIDENYRGEIKAVMFNFSDNDFNIEVGDRIAQICFFKTTKIKAAKTNELSQTNRGEGGFGSSGVK